MVLSWTWGVIWTFSTKDKELPQFVNSTQVKVCDLPSDYIHVATVELQQLSELNDIPPLGERVVMCDYLFIYFVTPRIEHRLW